MLTEILAEVRDAFKAAGLDALSYQPERIEPPVVLVGPGEPFITPGETASVDDWTFQLYVYVYAEYVPDNETVVDDLLSMIKTVIENVPGDWLVTEVSAPYTREANDANWLLVRIKINNRLRTNLYETEE